ncbi:MAG: hypothetical protein KF853_05935 [Rhodocyclaceae bacterium]|jgi:hypothetical protein|nr:hypothetical protein [Rhodocyclaceae bacterium]MCP5297817.1 hypothetical protein [Zoogloeaceae bacterium]PKO71721.1 MAG: hypothetical protein CVU20_05585 [Betaproteobacteria bacterium HGW-Betaproteobacteria-14]MBX3676541.1 hypothetical protein [Rhodocyclaceae bacterium]MBZ0142104.1 hypothetical protein [Rhodocyclaceae bacterium]
MKKTDLEKLKGLKIDSRMKQAGTPGRFGAAAASAVGRREQRERERALGLVPFAVKLDGELVAQLRQRATDRGEDLGLVVADLLRKGLAQ